MSTILFIIILYNQDLAKVQEMVNSLKRLKEIKFDIFFVNNRNPLQLDYQKELNLSGLQHTFVYPKENIGFAKGVNLGIKYAKKHVYQHIILLNDDAVIKSKYFEKFLSELKQNKYDIFGSAITNNERIDYRGGVFFQKYCIPRHLQYKHRLKSIKFTKQALSTDFVTGCFMVINRRVFNKILFDENLFMYFEDLGYCLKAKDLGFKVGFLDIPLIEHKKNSYRLGNLEAYFFARNPFAIIKQTESAAARRVQVLGQIFVWLPRNTLRLRSIAEAKSYFQGLKDGYKILKERENAGILRNRRS